MEVTKASEAVQVTANLAKSVSLPIGVMMNGEGDKLVIVAKNLDLIYKAVIEMESKIEIMAKELDNLKSSTADETAEETTEPEPISKE